jgi:hypothetical protein
MPGKTKTSKRVVCDQCAGTGLVRRITTYPVLLTGPLQGKQIHVGRPRWIAMSPWVFACSSDNYTDPPGPPREPLPVTHFCRKLTSSQDAST